MSRNFFNILEGFQKVEESLDGPEGQYVEDCWPKCRGTRFANMSRNTSQYVDKFLAGTSGFIFSSRGASPISAISIQLDTTR